VSSGWESRRQTPRTGGASRTSGQEVWTAESGAERLPGRLAGKVAIVTGAGSGIGRGIAEAFAREGAAVVVANRRPSNGEETVRRITLAGGTAHFQATDITRESDCAALVRVTVERYGRLDVLVNNAGIFPRATLEETTASLWEQIMATNLRGPFFLCKHAVPQLRLAGGGSIINLGSTNAYAGAANLFAYSCSKGGLLTLTRNLARALTRDRIRVNFLNPGWVVSEGELVVQGSEGHDAAWLEEMGRRQPLGRHQEPRDAAMAAIFLAADESTQVTGIELNCDAGRSMPGLGAAYTPDAGHTPQTGAAPPTP
jgi:NAD(P)-dependent dehydrogenase (short-subunit alcohol dehydrogenase family)